MEPRPSRSRERSPSLARRGRGLFFSSDRDGSYDLYMLSCDLPEASNKITRLSSFLTGAFDPCFSPDGRSVFFTAYQEYGFQVHQMTALLNFLNMERNREFVNVIS